MSKSENHKVNLGLKNLRHLYDLGLLSPEDLINNIYQKIRTEGDDHVWTHLVPYEEATARAKEIQNLKHKDLPLYGVPFSVKDNIHVKGLPTSAGCPAFEHYPNKTATVVDKLIDAGAILIGKNTMDQFATGLVGVRSPNFPVNPFNSEYIPGGSSSGSAVAVCKGLVSFSLGSDTGGSGRIPAALNNIVGLKPTPGVISIDGMIYANKSFDCVPIFARTCHDALHVFEVARELDIYDDFMLPRSAHELPSDTPKSGFKIGIPNSDNLEFFGDTHAEEAFNFAIDKIRELGCEIVELDFSPFHEIGKMVFNGPFLTERYISVGEFIENHPSEVDSVVSSIIEKSKSYSAIDVFTEYYRLQQFRHEAINELNKADAMMVPTAGTIYKISEILSNPISLNTNMGYYTYFVNLIGLSALAVPATIRDDGLPFGVCFIGGARKEALLVDLGMRFEKITNLRPGLNS